MTAYLRRARARSGRPWTLRAQLLAGVLALFMLVMLGTGLTTVFATRSYLTNQLRNDVLNAADRNDGPRGNGPAGRGADGPGAIPGGGQLLRLGISNGQVLTAPDGDPINHVVNVRTNTNTSLTTEQINELLRSNLGSDPKRVELGDDVGTYLLVATTPSAGQVYITGLPTTGVDHTVSELFNFVAAGTLIGLVIVGAGGSYLIRRNLEPLARVAATARQVSGLNLDSGDVALRARVPVSDTDDRTEVGQVGLALNSLLDNVEGALNARHESETRVRQFVADASHELRTPLASIRGYAELSRRESEPVPAGVVHALSRVESESVRMQGLVEDLLLLARLDSGRPLEHVPVDLTMLVVDAVSDAHAASPDHAWRLDLPDEPVEVMGDQARLHQVLANLLANARTHTPTGTTVTTSVRSEGDQVRLSVTDNGPGIPESLQPNVFQRFTRGDDSRNRASGSTGLGLSIVDAVTQAHGGEVELASTPEETTLSVILPGHQAA